MAKRNTLQLLKGNNTHLVVVPKLGSSAIRNFYSKNERHNQSSHDEYKISSKDTYIAFYKPMRDIFTSSIQTDFRASVINNQSPPNFPRYRNSIYRLQQHQRQRWLSLIETHRPNWLDNNWDSREWGDKNGFFSFAEHIIETAFSLSNDISWFVTGHFSESWNEWPIFNEESEIVYTDISSLSNPKFIKWLKKTDNFWEYLDTGICSTPKKFEGDNKWNVKPSNYEDVINNWIDRVKRPNRYMFQFNENYPNVEFECDNKNSIETTISANTQFLKSLERTFQLSEMNHELIKDTPKYLKF
tara:strand:- start:1439 stop:2338 length:900 start_codon:yes stop_codon:yes gene_type:complete